MASNFPAALPNRFWNKVNATRTGCWLWTGALADGYGMYWLDGRTQAAHRIAFVTLIGPIPKGREIDHLCRHRECVNPAHLRVVTHRENLLYGNSIQAHNARRTTCAKGHPLTVQILPSRTQRRCLTCRQEYQRAYQQQRKRTRTRTSQ